MKELKYSIGTLVLIRMNSKYYKRQGIVSRTKGKRVLVVTSYHEDNDSTDPYHYECDGRDYKFNNRYRECDLVAYFPVKYKRKVMKFV